MSEVPSEFRPRKCHVVKWPEFTGYGFNLHAEKGKAGQYIGKVDPGSPAEASGLRDGDRIVEVNSVNIGNENHQQVVSRIKAGGEETTLLVVSTEADRWYKEEKRVIKGDLPEVEARSAARGGGGSAEPAVETLPEPELPPPEPEVATDSVSNGVNGDAGYQPRLCHLKIWPTFQGYGFNLHAERDKPGQFIGLVDDASPASTAGLRVHDRIIEVNGDNVEQMTHGDVIGKIKAIPGETRLLVVDRETDAHYRERGTTVHSAMPNVIYQSSTDPSGSELNGDVSPPPPVEPEVTTNGQTEVNEVTEEMQSAAITQEESQPVIETEPEPVPEPEPEPVVESVPEPEPVPEPVAEPEPTTPAAPEPEPVVVEPTPEPVAVNGVKSSEPEPPAPEYSAPPAAPQPKRTMGATEPLRASQPDALGGGMTVAEMKERLRAQKKPDPRLQKMSFEQKYKDFQKM